MVRQTDLNIQRNIYAGKPQDAYLRYLGVLEKYEEDGFCIEPYCEMGLIELVGLR